MSDREIDSFPDLDSLSLAARDAFVQLVESTIAERGVFRVALSGGSTPKRLYQLLADVKLPWSQMLLFWGDERNVPSDHPESNYRMVREVLLEPAGVPSSSVCRPPINVEDPAETAEVYEEILRNEFVNETFPRWDLALQGMGDDAHTASLFPQTKAIDRTDRWFVENWVPQLDAYRLTLTAPAICSARNIWFLVAGTNKRQALQNVWEGPLKATDYPSQLIKPSEGAIRWFVTADANPLESGTDE